MNNIAGTPTLEEYAGYLLRVYEDPEKALRHAEWAYGHVTKAENKEFWQGVIELLKKKT